MVHRKALVRSGGEVVSFFRALSAGSRRPQRERGICSLARGAPYELPFVYGRPYIDGANVNFLRIHVPGIINVSIICNESFRTEIISHMLFILSISLRILRDHFRRKPADDQDSVKAFQAHDLNNLISVRQCIRKQAIRRRRCDPMLCKHCTEGILPNTAMHRIFADGDDQQSIQRRRLKCRIAPYIDKLGCRAAGCQDDGAKEQSSKNKRSAYFHNFADHKLTSDEQTQCTVE